MPDVIPTAQRQKRKILLLKFVIPRLPAHRNFIRILSQTLVKTVILPASFVPEMVLISVSVVKAENFLKLSRQVIPRRRFVLMPAILGTTPIMELECVRNAIQNANPVLPRRSNARNVLYQKD